MSKKRAYIYFALCIFFEQLGNLAISYTDGFSKFIIHPNYKMKISREVVKRVNFITATRRTDKNEFNGKRFIKIEVDGFTI